MFIFLQFICLGVMRVKTSTGEWNLLASVENKYAHVGKKYHVLKQYSEIKMLLRSFTWNPNHQNNRAELPETFC